VGADVGVVVGALVGAVATVPPASVEAGVPESTLEEGLDPPPDGVDEPDEDGLGAGEPDEEGAGAAPASSTELGLALEQATRRAEARSGAPKLRSSAVRPVPTRVFFMVVDPLRVRFRRFSPPSCGEKQMSVRSRSARRSKL
jgi:hypothetical protein